MSESFSVIYSPEAVNDLREIYTYIAYKLLVPKTAKGQINRIRDISGRLILCLLDIL